LCIIIDRVQRLKDARAEAAKEIEELKASKNDAFKGFELEVRKHTGYFIPSQESFGSRG